MKLGIILETKEYEKAWNAYMTCYHIIFINLLVAGIPMMDMNNQIQGPLYLMNFLFLLKIKNTV